MSTRAVQIDYTNWRGDRRVRIIRPEYWEFGSNQFHPEQQWLCYAVDLSGDGMMKSFAMSGIHSWHAGVWVNKNES